MTQARKAAIPSTEPIGERPASHGDGQEFA